MCCRPLRWEGGRRTNTSSVCASMFCLVATQFCSLCKYLNFSCEVVVLTETAHSAATGAAGWLYHHKNFKLILLFNSYHLDHFILLIVIRQTKVLDVFWHFVITKISYKLSILVVLMPLLSKGVISYF